MKVKFDGIKQARKSGGCSSCGRRKSRAGHAWTTRKQFFLPTGRSEIFRMGIPVEVNEDEAKFLLMWHYETEGRTVYPFHEV